MTCNDVFERTTTIMMKFMPHDHIPTSPRPLGFWLAAIDGPLRGNMREVFATFGVTRREWRTLTRLADAPLTADELEAALPPRGSGEHGGPGRAGRRTPADILGAFVARGWATVDDGRYSLTDEGRRIHDAVLTNVQTVRAQVTDGIPESDYATTMATLERIARNVGWEPGQRPRPTARGLRGGPGGRMPHPRFRTERPTE